MIVEIVAQERVQAVVIVEAVAWVKHWVDATKSGSGGSDLGQEVGGKKQQ